MARLTCQDCCRPVSDEAEVCSKWGRRTESSEASTPSIRQVGSVMRIWDWLVILIGVSTVALLCAPQLEQSWRRQSG